MKKAFWLLGVFYILIGLLFFYVLQFSKSDPHKTEIPQEQYVAAQEQPETQKPEERAAVEKVEPVIEEQKKNVWPENGWIRKDPAALGINTDKLKEAVSQLKGDGIHFKSVLVIKDGYLALEEYKSPNIRNERTHIKSCTKSVMSILIGIAVKQGIIAGKEQKVADLFPKYFSNNTEPLKKEMKLEHLLNMTAGFQWVQYGTVWSEWWDSKDRFKYTFSLPMSDKPGAKFNYSSAVAHLLSGIITEKSGMTTLEYANRYLFHPLGINQVTWRTDKKGYYQGNSELFLKPEDMAKIGYLYLKNGNWKGTQIVDESWVKESTTEKAPHTNYGYMWWTGNSGEDKLFYAAGYGGQFIYVYPKKNVVIVITSTVSEETNWSDHCLKVLETYFIPAFKTNGE